MTKQVITFHYELKGDAGEIIDSSREGEPISFLEGSNQIITGLEEALRSLKQGTSQEVHVPYQDAYGSYDQGLVAQVPRHQFPSEKIKPGDMFQIEKNGQLRVITVVDVTDELVAVDANHPLAGKNLNFWVELVNRRGATAEEVAHGHVHGHGGQQHLH